MQCYKKLCWKATIAAALVLAMSTQAQVVSYNFDNNGTVGGDGAGSGPVASATAGVVAAGYWYNDWPSYLTTDLTDSAGNPTTMDIGWANNSGTWAIQFSHPGQDGNGSWNKEMVNGYINGLGSAGAAVTLSEIPFLEYDVYVYLTSDDATRIGTVTDGATTYSFGVLDNMITGADALLVQTTDTGLSHPEANYALFSGLSGTSQTFSTWYRLGDDTDDSYGGISGIQIVAVPEPSTMALGAMGLLLIGASRRLRRS